MRKMLISTFLCLIFVLSVSCASADAPMGQQSTDTECTLAITDENVTKNDYLSNKIVLFDTSAAFENSNTTTVYVVTENNKAKQPMTDVYLYANVSGKEVVHHIGNYDSHSVSDGRIISLDVDRDGADELLLNMEITGNGGTVSYVYSYMNGAFVQTFDFENYAPELKCEAVSDCRIKVTFSHTDQEHIMSIADIYGDSIKNLQFDSNGIAQHLFYAYAGPIYHLIVIDGKVVCTMPLEIDHVYCYDINQTLEYDSATQAFVVRSYELVEINSER